MFTGLAWWEILLSILAGIALGGAFSYLLFYPLYEEFENWYKVEKELLETIIKIGETIAKTKNGNEKM